MSCRPSETPAAKLVVDIATGEAEDVDNHQKEKDSAAVALGIKGGQKGARHARGALRLSSGKKSPERLQRRDGHLKTSESLGGERLVAFSNTGEACLGKAAGIAGDYPVDVPDK